MIGKTKILTASMFRRHFKVENAAERKSPGWRQNVFIGGPFCLAAFSGASSVFAGLV